MPWNVGEIFCGLQSDSACRTVILTQIDFGYTVATAERSETKRTECGGRGLEYLYDTFISGTCSSESAFNAPASILMNVVLPEDKPQRYHSRAAAKSHRSTV